MNQKDYIDFKAFLMMVLLTLLWGLNYSAIKVSNLGFSPIFNSLLRSCIASFFGILYCIRIGRPLFHRDFRLFHGFVIGFLFGAEFVCIYLGMLYTDSSRAGIFINFSPFVVAILAHILLKEKLGLQKLIGLILAFLGVYFVFLGKPKYYKESMLIGDILELVAAFLWGLTTVYIKKYLAERVDPINTFLYQLCLSIPVILIFSLAIEEKWVIDIKLIYVLSLLYSSIVVAFLSYLAWFKLIHVYPVSDLSVFTFLSPVFGVIFGSLILGEELTPYLALGVSLVSLGIILTNARRRFI